ncbi:crossover junction endodeoxyribonuclease RuvC [Candidatus Peregrinibacteria bacterium CG_4_10_14_0_2_um_filter_41_8]|nr:MAG: crossover junction endodeoxyribonuclease RuvC [Candidatus Peregrinibacteria bacterium CG_4_10_14_0_2_um_filter_41_8]
MIILGIDPGYDLVGFGLIEQGNSMRDWHYLDGGVIKTLPKAEYWDRIEQIARDIETIIKEFKPNVCSLEDLFFSRNTKTGIKVAQARGVIGMKMQKNKIPIYEYGPSQVKLALTGSGRADKSEMQEMVRLQLNLDKIPQPDDFADALAIALCHGQSVWLGQ